jgi:hypothetical protein
MVTIVTLRHDKHIVYVDVLEMFLILVIQQRPFRFGFE